MGRVAALGDDALEAEFANAQNKVLRAVDDYARGVR